MTNQEVANLLRQIAKILEIKGDSTFRIGLMRKRLQEWKTLLSPLRIFGSVVSLRMFLVLEKA